MTKEEKTAAYEESIKSKQAQSEAEPAEEDSRKYPWDKNFIPMQYDKIPVMYDTPSEEQAWSVSFVRSDPQLEVFMTDNTFATKINKLFSNKTQRYDPAHRIGWAIYEADKFDDCKDTKKIARISMVGPKDSLSLASKCVDDPELSKTAWPAPEYFGHESGWKGSNPKNEGKVMEGRLSSEQSTEIVGKRDSFWAFISTKDNTMLTWIRKMCAANPYDPKKNPTGWRMERVDAPDKKNPLPKGVGSSERIHAWCPKGCIRFRNIRMDILAKAIELKSEPKKKRGKPEGEKPKAGSPKDEGHKPKPKDKPSAGIKKIKPRKKEAPKPKPNDRRKALAKPSTKPKRKNK
jgi:hypothetical protein